MAGHSVGLTHANALDDGGDDLECVVGADGLPPCDNAGNVLRSNTSLRLSFRTPPLVDAKAALEAAGTMLALALAPHVRVVGVAPGLTLTSHLLSDEKFQQLHALCPLGRSSTADDVASAVRFALENRSITGTTLLDDGGQHLMKFERDFSLM